MEPPPDIFAPPTVPAAAPPHDLAASRAHALPGGAATTHASGSAEALPRPGWGFWATCGWLLAILAVAVAAQVAAGLFTGVVYGFALAAQGGTLDIERWLAEHEGLLSAVLGLVSYAVVVPFLLIPILLRRRRFAEYLALGGVRAGQLAVWSLVLLAVIAAEVALASVIDRPPPPEMVRLYQTAGFLPLLWVFVVVGAPVVEELVFRGFVWRGFAESRVGVPGAVVLTTLLWTMLHVQYGPYELAWVFFLGILLGGARHVSGSTTLCILLHGLANLAAVVLLHLHVGG